MLDGDWNETLISAYSKLSPQYREYLQNCRDYFPNKENYFNAFKTLPKERVKYILFGQDPYPREESTTGYAFIDGKVGKIFSAQGLSKEVNRATSLRNFIKMALVARGDLHSSNLSQEAIAQISKHQLITTMNELRINFEKNGILLLNTALIFSSKKESRRHIKEWQPFVEQILQDMQEAQPKLILFGNHAKELKKIPQAAYYEILELEHPYNHTFVTNSVALEFFGAMNLLAKFE